MGIASLVLGIISFFIGWIPFINILAFILSVIGLILGIVDTVKKNKNGDLKKGVCIAGIVVCAIAVVIFGLYALITIGITGLVFDEAINIMQNGEYYYEDDIFDDYDYNIFDVIDYPQYITDNLVPQVI